MVSMWRSLSGKPIRDLAQAVQALLVSDDHLVHIGTDSQQYGYNTNYVTVVAIGPQPTWLHWTDPGRSGPCGRATLEICNCARPNE